ncbi:MAG: hypothetical protein JJU00_03405 [Opitutales bacterium]|nr:hypothetical protein [Opitutales bacterium]
MNTPAPIPLGLRKSFGFGDRLGLATPGHLAAAKPYDFAGIFAQQSIREMARTNRTPEEVMKAATDALAAAAYDKPWGADADHLKTRDDVFATTRAGFCFFTIDPSEYVNNAADTMAPADLEAEASKQEKEGIYGGESLESLYLSRAFETEKAAYNFDRESLLRAAVKYGRAVAYCEEMAGHIAEANKGRNYEIEVSVDETDSPTLPLEHVFFANELRRRGVTVVSLAPRFIGEFEKGIDYKGDHKAFEDALAEHVAIATAFGPYKISVHSGSDKFSVYPIIGRVCGDLLHVKTAGTSYLEALRVLARVDGPAFREIVDYSGDRFAEDRKTYHISVTDGDIPGLLKTADTDLERVFLDENHGRQVLHVTFGSVLTKGKAGSGRTFKEVLMEALEKNADLHCEVLEKHLGRHLAELTKG